MSKKIIQPPKDLQNPYIKSFEEYEIMYRESIENPKEFFATMALENLDWFEKTLLFEIFNLLNTLE